MGRLRELDPERLLYQSTKPGPGGNGPLLLTPLELLDRIAALVPPSQIYRHRYYGVLASHSPLRAAVTALAVPAATAPAGLTSAPEAFLWQHPARMPAGAEVGRRLGRFIAPLAFAGLACAQAMAAEPKSLALMDFELIDEMRSFASEQARREVDRRVVLITTELAKELQSRGMYRVLDRAPAAKLIERFKASYELRACNGCEIDIGKALGAERIALCWVQKVSNLILNINIEVRSVATGETVYAKSVDIRGNTDETWLRGVRRLVENIQERDHHLR